MSDGTNQSILSGRSSDEIETDRLYEAVVKVVLLEYSNEARFRVPVSAAVPPTDDVSLPITLMKNLRAKLKSIALNQPKDHYDTLTRNSLLRFYTDSMQPSFPIDLKPSALVARFAQASTKIITSSNYTDSKEINKLVSNHTITFVKIVIETLKNDKNREPLVAKFEESIRMLNPRSSRYIDLSHAQFLDPSYQVNDIDSVVVSVVERVFGKSRASLQNDVNRLKPYAQSKAYHRDIQTLNDEYVSAGTFSTNEGYERWKDHQTSETLRLSEKYRVPDKHKLISLPSLAGDKYYILPPYSQRYAYLIKFIRLSLQTQSQTSDFLLSNDCLSLLRLLYTTWFVDHPTRAVAIYTAINVDDDITLNEDYIFDIPLAIKALDMCKKVLQEGNLAWNDKHKWSIKDQNQWTQNLTLTYNKVALTIKNCVPDIYGSKPSRCLVFSAFLHDNIVSDILFPRVEATGLITKWEHRLKSSLLNLTIARYKHLYKRIPRNRKLEITDVAQLLTKLENDFDGLGTKFKLPLLGNVRVDHLSLVISAMFFSRDSVQLLKHISHYDDDTLYELLFSSKSIYKSLKHIFSVFQQLVDSRTVDVEFLTTFIKLQIARSTNTKYFEELGRVLEHPHGVIDNIEQILFPVAYEYAEHIPQRIRDIVASSIQMDTFLPLQEDQKFSTSPKDMFKFVNDIRSTIDELEWTNADQSARIYAKFLRGVSNGAIDFSETISSRVAAELIDKEHNPNFKFRRETCVALNDLSKVIEYLTTLDTIKSGDVSSIASSTTSTSHVYTIRVVRADNLMCLDASGNSAKVGHPYIQLIDIASERVIGKTRTLTSSTSLEWDEEFEITVPNSNVLKLSLGVWDEGHKESLLCGRSSKEFDFRKFSSDGTPQEFELQVGVQGTLVVEVSVEKESGDAMFLMGKAFRSLQRSQDRSIKCIVEKFDSSIASYLSVTTLSTICSGKREPTEDEVEHVLDPLKHYLNTNLQVLAQSLTRELLQQVIEATWNLVVSHIDDMILPRLTSASSLQLLIRGSVNLSLHSTFSSAMATLHRSTSINRTEFNALFYWLDSMKGFFDSDVVDVSSNPKYQSLLLLPDLYYKDTAWLIQQVDQLSESSSTTTTPYSGHGLTRLFTRSRTRTIRAHATIRTRREAAALDQQSRQDPTVVNKAREDMLLRLLIARNEKRYVVKQLKSRERHAHDMAISNLAMKITQTNFR
ncbi:uncharacterized protein RJT21DRAFT_121963 [Scheffersomyces amazonensis]|uniref:uncharacterized protein n=1 Tax=Scheffersomyces amazonensis TaxID=1078765 RepID=UPI00315D9ED4